MPVLLQSLSDQAMYATMPSDKSRTGCIACAVLGVIERELAGYCARVSIAMPNRIRKDG